MIKLITLLNEIEQERREQQLEEGWKENIIAIATAASMLAGGVKGQTPGGNIGSKAGIEMTSKKQQGPGPLDVNFGTAFPSGRYIIKGDAQGTLESKLGEIAKYIEQNPNADYTIEIISSESQVPNYDAEKPGRVKLDTGELAEKRATVLNVAIKALTQKLKDDGKLSGNVNIKVAPVLIGSEKFTPGVDNKDDAKYTKDQFVKIRVTAKPEDKFAAYSKNGERIFMNQKAYAMIFYPTASTTSRSSAGMLNTAYQDVLLKKIDRAGLERSGRSINSRIDAPNQYTATYKIPWDQWNKATSGTNTITQSMMDGWEQFRVAD
jgi:hypothetical protein